MYMQSFNLIRFEKCTFNVTSRDTWPCHHDVRHKSADGTLCVCGKYKVDLIDKCQNWL